MIFLIGATKCGTTSIDSAIKGSQLFKTIRVGKETNHFVADKVVLGTSDRYSYRSIRNLSLSEYFELFHGSGEEFEACTSYFHFSDEFIKGLSSGLRNRDVKIVLILRSPKSRAFSAYKHCVRDGIEDLPFDKAIKEEFEGLRSQKWFMLRYFAMSLYANNVKNILENFSNVLILDYDALKVDSVGFGEILSKHINCEHLNILCLNKSDDPLGAYDLYGSSWSQKFKKYLRMAINLDLFYLFRRVKSKELSSSSVLIPEACAQYWASDIVSLRGIFPDAVLDKWLLELDPTAYCNFEGNPVESVAPIIFKKGFNK